MNNLDGGQLTEALKKHPFAIVLLDEIEKAHPFVLKTFLQVFEEGYVTDSQGMFVDCRQVLFILTTNLGAEKILTMHQEGYDEEKILSVIQKDVTKFISPELYNRLEAVPFRGIGPELMEQLIVNMLVELQIEMKSKKNLAVAFDASLIEFLKLNGFDYELGARPLKRLIQKAVMKSIAHEFVSGNIHEGDSIIISYEEGSVAIKLH